MLLSHRLNRSLLTALVIRCALEDVRLAVRTESVADVRIERMRVGSERVVGVGCVGMRRVERIVRRRSRARTRMDAGSNTSMTSISRKRVHLGRSRKRVPQSIHVVRYEERNLQNLWFTHGEQELLLGATSQSIIRADHQHEVVLTSTKGHYRTVRIPGDRCHRRQLQDAEGILGNCKPSHGLIGMSGFRLEEGSTEKWPFPSAC